MKLLGRLQRAESRCFEIEDSFALGRHLHRQISWLRAPQDAVDIRCRLSIQVDEIDGEAEPRDRHGMTVRRKCL